MLVEKTLNRSLSVAPMMDWTDRHERYFLRLFSRHILLYTEMITADAVLRGRREQLLKYHRREHPVALQLGGSDPEALARCARIGAEYGYDEINLNVGCPSDRVRAGRFGACLMAEPERVGRCVEAMREAVEIPVTVKTRIGIDGRDSYADLVNFVQTVSGGGCQVFVIHARKAWLQGLSPKQNREIPPLRYNVVYRLKQDFPDLTVILNGGITTREQVRRHLEAVDGVMIGREAYQNPYFLASMDQMFYGDTRAVAGRGEILDRFCDYVEDQLQQGMPLVGMTRHIQGLFQGLPGARAWRRHLSENAHRPGSGVEVIRQAASFVPADR
ncbi:MAG: tRNA dihydrouridine(20/20a) synthase DusA [Candidatus Latescibacteria bacterium]|nr:tRNA dihydrouridine(20/20a) synthase DusA [Candidatus Latescibacterota bacterium]